MIKNKKAFTFVEIVFVIMILGILSSVVIPRLMLMRDNAKISLCIQETTQFLSEVSIYYTSNGYFTDVSKMTNLKTTLNPLERGKGNGFSQDINLNIPSIIGSGTAITYRCDGFNSIIFQTSIDKNGTVWISSFDGSVNEIGMGKNASKALENKDFFKKYQVGGTSINQY